MRSSNGDENWIDKQENILIVEKRIEKIILANVKNRHCPGPPPPRVIMVKSEINIVSYQGIYLPTLQTGAKKSKTMT